MSLVETYDPFMPLVVEGDPLSDLLALQRVRLVVKAGEIVFRR